MNDMMVILIGEKVTTLWFMSVDAAGLILRPCPGTTSHCRG